MSRVLDGQMRLQRKMWSMDGRRLRIPQRSHRLRSHSASSRIIIVMVNFLIFVNPSLNLPETQLSLHLGLNFVNIGKFPSHFSQLPNSHGIVLFTSSVHYDQEITSPYFPQIATKIPYLWIVLEIPCHSLFLIQILFWNYSWTKLDSFIDQTKLDQKSKICMI